MKVLIKPRLQKDKWSLYWKTSMATRTHALDDFELDVDPSTDTPRNFAQRWPGPSVFHRRLLSVALRDSWNRGNSRA